MATLQQRGVLPPLWCCRCLPRQPRFISCWAPGAASVSSFLLLLGQVRRSQLKRWFYFPLVKFLHGSISGQPLVLLISTIDHCCCCHAVSALRENLIISPAHFLDIFWSFRTFWRWSLQLCLFFTALRSVLDWVQCRGRGFHSGSGSNEVGALWRLEGG